LELLGRLLGLSLHWLHVSKAKAMDTAEQADHEPGPFELTKLSAQVSVLMAERKTSVSDPVGPKKRAVAASYQNKGTFKTAKNIIKHRGIGGLYSGFNLHLCKWRSNMWLLQLTRMSEGYNGNRYLFYDIRE
jgi:hypothetical protein